MKATVTVPFKGVEDGEIYPKEFKVGDSLSGDAAKVAVENGWAEEVPDELPLAQPDEPKPKPSPKPRKVVRRKRAK